MSSHVIAAAPRARRPTRSRRCFSLPPHRRSRRPPVIARPPLRAWALLAPAARPPPSLGPLQRTSTLRPENGLGHLILTIACYLATAGIRKFRILEKWIGSRNAWYSDLTAFHLNFRRARRLTHKWVSDQQKWYVWGNFLSRRFGKTSNGFSPAECVSCPVRPRQNAEARATCHMCPAHKSDLTTKGYLLSVPKGAKGRYASFPRQNA